MRLRPRMSESAPEGSLKNTPVMVEAATMTPMSSGRAPRSAAKMGRTGVRAIWEPRRESRLANTIAMNAFIRKIRIDPTGLSIGSCKFASRRLQNFSGAREAPNLFRYPVGDFVEQRHTIGLCPQSDLSRMRESRVFDL